MTPSPRLVAPPAKYATKRNYDRPTLGPIVGKVSEIVRGRKLMPWQQEAADILCELSTEHLGEWQYLEGDISVPRQAGKSDLVNAILTARLIAFNGHKAYMTAQTGRDAGKRWRSLVQDLDLARGNRALDWKVSRGKGAEELVNLVRGSRLSPFAPTPDSLHGDALNTVTIDETWAFSADEGAALETAIKPTFLTVGLSQLIRVSTMGTANSAYLNANIELGRQATADPGARRFYIEYSADEDEADRDPYSDATLAFHPAIGYTQSARRIRDLGKGMSVGAWRRSYLNLPTLSAETVINLAAWDSCRWDYDGPGTAREQPARPEDYVISFDVATDGSGGSIFQAWLDESGRPEIAHLASAPGTEWLAPVIEKLARSSYRAIVADNTGPNMTVIDELTAREVTINVYSYGDYAAACQTLLDRVRTRDIVHDGHESLEKAINVAATRATGRATIFDSAKSAGPIDALKAAALAQHAATVHLRGSVLQLY